MYYASSTHGFYERPIPGQTVEITDEEYFALLDGQSSGKVIVANENGYPVLADPPPAEPVIPQVVSMRQARLALLEAGHYGTVNTAIAAMEGAEGDAARIEWEFAIEVRRDSALVQTLIPLLGLDEAAVDALFVQAAGL
jgi:hypothetical protein